MNEKRIDLPSGGIAWLTTIADHRQAKSLRRIQLRLSRFTERGEWRSNLTNEERDELEDLILSTTALNVRTFTTRWENVRAPNGDPLDLGREGDIERMQERDIEFLFDSIEAALREGRADPNSSKPRSGSTRGRATSRKTTASAST